MIDACSKELSHYRLVRVSKTMMFIFTENMTLVATPLQLFKITYNHGNFIKRLKDLPDLAERGEIKTHVDLIDYCRPRPGRGSQMHGLELVQMEVSWVK